MTYKIAHRWLSIFEHLGYTKERHVGKTDEYLTSRLAESPDISGASTFSSQPTAESVISSAVISHESTILRWLNDESAGRQLVLRFEGDEVIGRGIMNGESSVSDRTNAVIVLRKGGPRNYPFHVYTAYPTR